MERHPASQLVMAYAGLAYVVMTYTVMACVGMAYIVMACVGMAYIVMAYIVMAYDGDTRTDVCVDMWFGHAAGCV